MGLELVRLGLESGVRDGDFRGRAVSGSVA